MRTIATRTYTNVVLTLIALVLAALLLQPYVALPTAQAQFDEPERNVQQSRAAATLNSNVDNADATREVAQANRGIAKAIAEAAKAQSQIAKAIERLASSN